MTSIVSANVLNRGYQFDQADRILQINDPVAGLSNWQYSHDALDRLQAQILDNRSYTYSYDANSNRTSRRSATEGSVQQQSTYTVSPGSNRISTEVRSEGGTTANLTYDGSRTYNYDRAGRLATVVLNGIRQKLQRGFWELEKERYLKPIESHMQVLLCPVSIVWIRRLEL